MRGPSPSTHAPITGRPWAQAGGAPRDARWGQGAENWPRGIQVPLLKVATVPPAFRPAPQVLSQPNKADGMGQGPSLPPKERGLMGKRYSILRAEPPGPVALGRAGRSGQGGQVRAWRKEWKLGLAEVYPVPRPLGVSHQGLHHATRLAEP